MNVRRRTVGLAILSLGLILVFLLAPIGSLPTLGYPPGSVMGGATVVSCDHVVYKIDRQPSLSAALLGFGVVRFEVAKYSPEACNWIGPPYANTYYIWTWDTTNVTQYPR
jgi:hypothetical protein